MKNNKEPLNDIKKPVTPHQSHLPNFQDLPNIPIYTGTFNQELIFQNVNDLTSSNNNNLKTQTYASSSTLNLKDENIYRNKRNMLKSTDSLFNSNVSLNSPARLGGSKLYLPGSSYNMNGSRMLGPGAISLNTLNIGANENDFYNDDLDNENYSFIHLLKTQFFKIARNPENSTIATFMNYLITFDLIFLIIANLLYSELIWNHTKRQERNWHIVLFILNAFLTIEWIYNLICHPLQLEYKQKKEKEREKEKEKNKDKNKKGKKGKDDDYFFYSTYTDKKTKKKRFYHDWKVYKFIARYKGYFKWKGTINLLGILAFYIEFFFPETRFRGNKVLYWIPTILSEFLIIRLFLRIVHMKNGFAKHFNIVVNCLRDNSKFLFNVYTIFYLGVLVMSPIYYHSEIFGSKFDPKQEKWISVDSMGEEKEASVHSIVESSWWAAVTMVCIGYGDYYPFTVQGKIVAFFGIMFSMFLFLIPNAILYATFADDFSKANRDEAIKNAIDESNKRYRKRQKKNV
jgi:hypothetical protein